MSTATLPVSPRVWTEKDLLAFPDDGVRRWIINGQLREQPSEFPEIKMTVRNRHHCAIMSRVAATILFWLRSQPMPRGDVYSGEAGVRLPGREATVGVDVAYASPDVVAAQNDDTTTLIDGVPTLVVEILSPNVTQEQLKEKLAIYKKAGVPVAWVIDPEDRTVTVYRAGREPELFNVTHRLPEHPAMPGFSPAVLELFE